MMTWWAREINLWHIPGSNKSIDAKFDDGNQGEKLVSRIELQVCCMPDAGYGPVG